MYAFVILDRDGVINEDSPDYIKSVDEWIPVPGSLEAIARLTKAGIDVYVATNQAGVARGKLTLESMHAIHRHMLRTIEDAGGRITDLRFCPHHPDDNCDCRKPRPGMLLALAESNNLDLCKGCYVGDSLKDLEAGESAGCTAVLVLTGKGESTLAQRPDHEAVYTDLQMFVDYILRD